MNITEFAYNITTLTKDTVASYGFMTAEECKDLVVKISHIRVTNELMTICISFLIFSSMVYAVWKFKTLRPEEMEKAKLNIIEGKLIFIMWVMTMFFIGLLLFLPMFA